MAWDKITSMEKDWINEEAETIWGVRKLGSRELDTGKKMRIRDWGMEDTHGQMWHL